jgi:Tfp pilus assembly protein PilN
VSFALNLASRPFRNERLPALVFGAACVLLLALTVRHAVVALRLLPGRTSALMKEVDDLEAELGRVRAETQSLRRPRPDKATIAQWALVKELVDRRSFSWTTLLSRLEAVLPPAVRLVSITPEAREGILKLKIAAVSRTAEDGLALVGKLDARKEFSNVFLLSQTDAGDGGAECTYEMVYFPVADAGDAADAAPAEAPAPSASPDDEAAPAEDETEPVETEATP